MSKCPLNVVILMLLRYNYLVIMEDLVMSFKEYDQNQLMIPMSWTTLIEKDHVSRVVNDVIDKMNLDTLLQTYSNEGCSAYNPRMLLKVLMYAYVTKNYSSRLMTKAVKENIYFIWLAGGNQPTRNVINSFRGQKMQLVIEEVFTELMLILADRKYVDLNEYFQDGTKIEANANRYTFVWKGSVEKNREKLLVKTHALMQEINKLNDEEDIEFPDVQKVQPQNITSEQIEEFANRLSQKLNNSNTEISGQTIKATNKNIKALCQNKDKLEKYNKQLEIIGENRNSYSKTDTDATFMRMKDDHMRNGQLKPGYNAQISANNGFIIGATVSQDRTDFATLIPTIKRTEKLNKNKVKKVCADSGYGNLENYEYLKKNKKNNFVKYTYFHMEQKKSFKKKLFNVVNLDYDDKLDEFTCPNSKKIRYSYTKKEKTDNGYPQEIRVYECEDCSDCKYKSLCTKSKGNRKINYNKKLQQYKEKAKKNLLSKQGLHMRSQRPEQVERPFAQIKWNKGIKRFLLRGLRKVDTEWCIICMAYDIEKIFNKMNKQYITT